MNDERSLVVVAGATGYLGRHVVRALHQRGARVRALVRAPEGLGQERSLCDEIVVAQATRKETLTRLFDGADFAFSSIGIRHFRRHPNFRTVDLQANLNLVEAAEAADVRRFAFVSVLHGAELARTSPLVRARESVVRRLESSRMQSLIVRPTGFFNDMGDFLEMARRRRAWVIGTGETRINPVSGADLASVCAKLLLSRSPPRAIEVGGPKAYTQREIAELAFSLLGTTPRISRVPVWLVRLLAHLIQPFNENAAALALMFSSLGDQDAEAPAQGEDQLESFFQSRISAQKSAN